MLTAIRGDQIKLDQLHNGHVVGPTHTKFGGGIAHEKLNLTNSIVASFLNTDQSVHRAVLDSHLVALWNVALAQAVSGSSIDATTVILSTLSQPGVDAEETATMGTNQKGVLTTGTGTGGAGTTNYRVQIRDASTKDPVYDNEGGQVYGELTNSAIGSATVGNYTLAFKKGDGTAFTMAVAETSKIDVVADVAVENVATGTASPTYYHSLNGTYFNIASPTQEYYVWYRVSGETVLDPAALNVGKTGVPVIVSPLDDATAVALATKTAIDALADFTATSSLGAVNVTNANAGIPIAALADGLGGRETGFGVQVITKGAPTVVDFMFIEVFSYLTAPVMSFATGIGFADIVGIAGSHNHHDLYYTKIELESGQLDNRYYTKTQVDSGQLDNRYYTESELDPYPGTDNGDAKLDTRYYKESEIASTANGSSGAKLVGVAPVGSLSSSNVQAALVELQTDIDNIVNGQLDINVALDDAYDDGSVVAVDNTDVDWRLTDTKTFKVTADAGATGVLSVTAGAAGDVVAINATLDVTGTTNFVGPVNQSGGAVVVNAGAAIDVDGTNITIDGTAASSLATTSAPLTLETKTSGNLTLRSASELYLKDVNLGTQLPLSQAGQTGLSNRLSVATTSIVGAINENSENYYQLVTNILPSVVDGNAGADKIGATGITGVIPTGGTLGGNGSVQSMLEGLAKGSAGGKVFPTLGTAADGTQNGDPTAPGSLLAEKSHNMFFKANEIVYVKDVNRFVMVLVAGGGVVENTDWCYLWGSTAPMAGPVFKVTSDNIVFDTTGSFNVDVDNGLLLQDDSGGKIAVTPVGQVGIDAATGQAIVLYSNTEVEINGGALVDVFATAITLDGKLTATGNANDDMIIQTTGTGQVQLKAADEIDLTGGNIDINAGAGKVVTVDSDTSIKLTAPITEVVATTKVDVTSPAINTTGVLTQVGATNITGATGITGSVTQTGASFSATETGDFTVSAANVALTATTKAELKGATADVTGTTVVDIVAPAINSTGVLTQTGNTQIIGDVNLDGSLDLDGASFDVLVTGAASIDSAAASNFTVAGANLTLSTTTAGNVVVDAATVAQVNAPTVDINGSTSVTVDAPAINTTGVITQVGNVGVTGDTSLTGNFTQTGATFTSTLTGNFKATTDAVIDLDAASFTLDAGGAAVALTPLGAVTATAKAGQGITATSTATVQVNAGTLDLNATGPATLDAASLGVTAATDGNVTVHTAGQGIIDLYSETRMDVTAPLTQIYGDVRIVPEGELFVDKIHITSVDPGDHATITGERSGTLNPLNQLSNPGFELGSGVDATVWVEGSNTVRNEAERYYGTYSMNVFSLAALTAGTDTFLKQTVQGGVTDSGAYRVAIYARGTVAKPIMAKIGGGVADQLVPAGNYSGWVRYDALLTAGSTNEDLEFYNVNLGGEKPDFFIDALMLEDATAGQPGATAASDYFTNYHSNLVMTIGDSDDDQIIFRSAGTATQDLVRIYQDHVYINGNLVVTGSRTDINVTELLVSDNEIILNKDVVGTPALDAFLSVERGTSHDAQLKWNESTDKWELWNAQSNSYETIVSSATGDVSVSLDSAYNGGSSVVVDATDVVWSLGATKKFEVIDGSDTSKFVITGGNTDDSVKINTAGGVLVDAVKGVVINGALTQTGVTQITGATTVTGAFTQSGTTFGVTTTGAATVAAGTSFGVTAASASVNVTGALALDAAAASHLTVTGADLSLSTVTDGDVNVSSADKVNVTGATEVVLTAPAINTNGVLTQTGATQIIGAMNLDGAIDHDGTAFDSNVTGDFVVTSANTLLTSTTEIDLTAPTVDINGSTAVTVDAPAINTTGVLTQTGATNITGLTTIVGAVVQTGASFSSTVTGALALDAAADSHLTVTGFDLAVNAKNILETATVEIDLTAPTVDINGSTAVTVDAPAINTTGVLTQTGNAQIVGDLDLNGSFDQTGNYTFKVDSSNTAVDAVKVQSAGGIDIDAAATVAVNAQDIKTTGALLQTGTVHVVGDMNLDGSIDADGADINFNATGTGGTHLQLTSADAASLTAKGITLEAGTGALVAEADAASSVNVTGANLTLGTTTSGTVALASAGAITFDDSYQTNPLAFSQASADGLATEFAYNAQTDFDWTVRTTGTAPITSLLGAVNANRQDLYEYVELLSTQGAAVGTAAGANLIGVDGITGVVPMDGGFNPVGAVGADATLQEILNGLATSSGGGKVFANEATFLAAKAAGVYFKNQEHIRILDTSRTAIILTQSTGTARLTDWDYLYGVSRPIGWKEYVVTTAEKLYLTTDDFNANANTFDVVATGDVLIDGATAVTVDAAANLKLTSGATMDMDAVTYKLDGTTFDADFLGAFVVDANANSQVNVTTGSLTLSTQTSGDINVSSVGNIVEAAVTLQQNVQTLDVNATGAFTLDAGAASFLRTTSANLNLQTVGSGEINFKDARMAAALPLTDVANAALYVAPGANALASLFDAINRAYKNTGDTSKMSYYEAPALTSTQAANNWIQVSDDAGLFDGIATEAGVQNTGASYNGQVRYDLPGGTGADLPGLFANYQSGSNLSLTPSQLRNTYGIFTSVYLNGLRLSDSEWVYLYDASSGKKVISFNNDHATVTGFTWSTVNAVDAIALSTSDHIVIETTYNRSSQA